MVKRYEPTNKTVVIYEDKIYLKLIGFGEKILTTQGEMKMLCVYCESNLPERAVFCPSCAKQIKCKQCSDFLEADAKACIICGTVVGEGIVTPSNNNSVATTKNTLILRETKSSRDVEVGFTDEAIGKISDALSHILIDRLGNPITPGRKASSASLQLAGGTAPESKDYIDVESAEVVPDSASSFNQTAKTDKEKLHQVFYYNDDVLKLDNYNLKADGQLDAAKRLVYLFLYAHELEGRNFATREAINAVLKDIGLYDPNASNWISTTPDLAQEGDEVAPTFRLRANGREAAQNALADIFNSDKANKWNLTERTKSRKKAKSAATDSTGKDTQTGASKPSKKSGEVDSWVTKWKTLSLDVDVYSAIGSTVTENKGVIALWVIRKATSDEIKVVNGNQIVSFISKAFGKDIDRRNLTRAMEGKAQGKVRRVTDGYELTDEGITHAEEILKFKSASEAAAKATKPPKSK